MNKQFKAWKESKKDTPGIWTFEDFKKETGIKEYQCFYLNPEYRLAHDDDAEILLQTDCLAEACTFVYNKFKAEGRDIAVYQARSHCYREIYQKPKRDKKGRFLPK